MVCGGDGDVMTLIYFGFYFQPLLRSSYAVYRYLLGVSEAVLHCHFVTRSNITVASYR